MIYTILNRDLLFFSGTPALTTRGLVEKDIDQVVDYIDKALTLAKEVSEISGPKLVDFKKALEENAGIKAKIDALRNEIQTYSEKFPMPGYQDY